VALVYQQLRHIAGALRARGGGGSLQPTELVHEAFVRLAAASTPAWSSEGHFRAVAARAMRMILIDRARRRAAARRGGGRDRVTLADLGMDEQQVDLVALDEVLGELEALDPRGAELVVLRVFGGLDHAEAAEQLGVAERTVRREWRRLRAWLITRLQLPAPGPDR
jgi:RNA polymerase sigma factor (TIGR02999 family)